MADETQPALDISIYGGKTPIEPRDGRTLGEVAADQYVAPAPVPASSISKGSPLLDEGAANLRANAREEASWLASVGAAITQWLPAHAYNYLKTPDFPEDKNFSSATFLKNVPIQLTKEDEEFISLAKSTEDATHRLETIESRNDAHRAMGDNPVLSFIGQALDPAYLAIDTASLGTTRLLRGGRFVNGAVAAAYTAGALTAEGKVTPVSTQEIVLGSMLMGAVSGALYKGGKLIPKDAEFPTGALNKVAEDMHSRMEEVAESSAVKREAPMVRPEPEGVPVRDGALDTRPQPKFKAQSGREILKAIESGPDPLLGTMAKRLGELMADDVEVRMVAKKDLHQGAREFYDPNQHAVFISKGTDARVQLHELTHAMTTHKLEFGLKNPNSAIGKITSQIEGLRQVAIKAAKEDGVVLGSQAKYYLSNLHEFVAGVYSGKTPFAHFLSTIPAEGKSVLSSMVDKVRRVLGIPRGDQNALLHTIGLSEDLMGQKLNVSLHAAVGGVHTTNAPGSFSLRMAPPPVGAAASAILKTISKSKDVAHAIEWSWHNSFGKFSTKAAEIADLLMDSPTSTGMNSAAGIQRAVRADLAAHQYKYEGALLEAMGQKGAGLRQRIFNTRESVRVQQAIEKEVYGEMMRRNRAAVDGVKIAPHSDPAIVKMADALDALSANSLKEMQAAGVAGAAEVSEMAGYVTRRWDIAKLETIERRILESGATPQAARQQIADTISIGIQRANGWDAEVAQDVAGAIFDRTKRKGMFQDAEFTSKLGEDSAEKLRSLLNAEGLSGGRLDRVMEVLAGKADEAGKLPTMKNRVDMHLDENLTLPDGSTVSIMDMLDTNVSALTERYLDTASSRVGLAQKGIKAPSDIVDMRKALADSIDDLAERGKAVKSFDEMMNVLHGNPVGEEVLSGIRNIQAVTQMIGLAKSGLWQLTEYSTIMAQYGALATMKSIIKEMPFVRDMMAHEKDSLREVLSRNSSQDTRLRPFINRMEDNFEIPMSDALKLSLMQTKQLVPYANAMKFIQRHQARTSANLIVDTLVRATKGDAKAIAAMAEYGLESGNVVKVASDIATHGMDTSLWSHATWNEVRGPLTKMMDDAVLRARLGEIPQFAHTSTLGKFLFTFRSFTLAAHNKVLAKTLHSHGYGGLGLLLAYQIPMTVLATAAGTGASGKPQETMEKTVAQAFGQVGALGLFTEAFGVISGQKQQFGSPGLIAVDRMYKVAGAAASGKGGDTTTAVLNTVPILSSFLPTKALGEALKSKEE